MSSSADISVSPSPAEATATNSAFVDQENPTAKNDSLRPLMEQASIDETLLAQAGIDAKHFEAAAKLREPVLRIESTLATLSAIASQSLRTATSHQHGQQAIEERFVALGRAHDLWR